MKIFAKTLVTSCVAVVVIGLAGCSINRKINDDINSVEAHAQKIRDIESEAPKYSRVTLKTGFYVPPLSKQEAAMPDWYFKPVKSEFSAVPFYLIVNQLLKGKSVTPKYNELDDADRMSPITIAFKSDNGVQERLGDALFSLAKTGGYALTFSGDAVTFNKFEERTFPIAALPGSYNSQIGNDGELKLSNSTTNDTTSSGTSASMDAGNRQYSSLTLKDKSLISDLKNALGQLKTEQGKIEISELTQSVFVKDRPANVEAIGRVIDRFNEDLTRRVQLDIRLLDVVYTANNRHGIDYSAISNLLKGKGVIKSAAQAFAAGAGTTPMPAQFDLQLTSGDLNGTQIFIDALQQQADISREISIPVELSNGSMSKVMSVDNTMFVSEQYGSNATASGVLTSGGATQETLQTGQIVNVTAKTFGDDIMFKINASISAKVGITKKSDEATGLYLESPETTAMIFDQTAILENGVTRIISGIKSQSINVSDSNAGYDALGYSRTSETSNKQTIMVVTARITRGLVVRDDSLVVEHY